MLKLILVFLLLGIAASVFEWIFSSVFIGSSQSSSHDESSTADDAEEEDTVEEEDDDTLLAIMVAHDLYELEKKRSHAVCSQCRNASWSTDEDGNEYCECPHIGWLHSWEADHERYCEHYHA